MRTPKAKKVTYPQIALLVETSTSWGRRIIEGVLDYSRTHGPWICMLEPRGIEEPESLPSGWKGDGIIARIRTPAFASRLARLGVPIVNVSGIVLPKSKVPRVVTDESLIAKMALEHLRARGFTHYGYSGVNERRYVAQRAHIFAQVVEAAGFDCHVHMGSPNRSSGADVLADQRDRADWLKSLPKPVAIATWGALQARRVAEAAQLADLNVPEDVAIIGVDTDDLVGELMYPPLSAVQLATERTGFEAASMLDKLMRGEQVPQQVLIPPLGISERQSTDVFAIDDPDVREAVRFIRQNANRSISVGDVLDHVSASRRMLERRFRELLQRTPAQEIRRVHIERAKLLLAQTNMPIPKVAAASGFNYVEHMIPLFRKTVGVTPLAYRRQMQQH